LTIGVKKAVHLHDPEGLSAGWKQNQE